MSNKNIKLTQNEICDKWLIDKTRNPETSRKIKESGAIYKNLAKKCLKDIKSSEKSFKSARSNFSLDSEAKKINAEKIQKLFIPYIKRITVNIIDRINYYLIIKKNLLTIKNTKNCVRLYNIDNKTNHPIYRVGKNIILDKQIGSESVYGIVFLSHFKSNIKYGNKFDKLNKFAVKITNQSKDNKNEIKFLNKLTKLVIDFKCPHFPISYGYLRCNNNYVKSNNSDDYSIISKLHNKKNLFPKLVNENKSLLIQINELASGDLSSNLISGLNKDILNTFTQVLISIMFFHHYTLSNHNDTHPGNFLYHKIKPGGYFHYNIYDIDYYLENKGYLWVIWDFGRVKNFEESDESIVNDYIKLFTTLEVYYRYNFLSKDEFIVLYNLYRNIIKKYDNDSGYYVYNINLLEEINKQILYYLLKNVSSFTTIKPLNIINNKPYIITETIIKPDIIHNRDKNAFQNMLNIVKSIFTLG